jgi:hypothetical protein
LLDGWQRLAQTLFPWHEQIGREARAGAVLHDETATAGYSFECNCSERSNRYPV